MGKKLVRVMNTSFRDGFQSVYGARVLTRDFLPAVEAACEAGIRYFESGGGARFQSLFFYCNENAFDMMDSFRETVGPEVELQTLARGINVVGLESQSSDIIKLHAELFKKHGVTSIRNFDALNDVNNLVYSGQCIVDAGLKHQVVITMMELPPGCEGSHTPEYYAQVLQQILDADISFNSVCFKDASGTSTPAKVHETIRLARKKLPPETKIIFHTHDTAGTGVVTYRAALDAGADGLDLAMVPVSGGTGQPDVITMWHALRGTEYDLGVDIDKIVEAEAVFKDCMKDYFLPPEACMVDPLIIFSPMPGGALTANTQMMRDNGIMDRYPEVIKAMSEVVRRGGFGTSVTPVSQFYFQQAFNNVFLGPWKKIADGYGKMVLGYFGRTPVAPDPEIIEIASKQMEMKPTSECPLKINDADPTKGVEAARKKLEEADIEINDENIFIAATCGDKGIAYLKGEARVNVRKNKQPSGCVVTLENNSYQVVFDGNRAVVNGRSYNFDIAELNPEAVAASLASSTEAASAHAGATGPAGAAHAGATGPTGAATVSSGSGSAAEVSGGKSFQVSSPMPGAIIKVLVKIGDQVSEDDTLFILEAMKMETEVKAAVSGRITSINVSPGGQVAAGETMAVID